MKVVTPYRPFPAESAEHQELGPFDWEAAIRMLRTSVERSCRCETVVITDIDTTLDGPSFQYATRERRLMLWMLEIAEAYIRSEDFTEDTVMVCPDMLVYQDLRPWFRGSDIGILWRTDQRFVAAGRPILNSVQFWRHAGRAALASFYKHVREVALDLPEALIRWGGDSEPLRQALDPFGPGRGTWRLGGGPELSFDIIDAEEVLEAYSETHRKSKPGKPKPPRKAVMDFRYLRKREMAAYFAKTIGAAS